MLDLPGCEVSVMFTGGGTNNNSSIDSTKDMVLNERIMSQWLNLVWFSNVPSSSLLIAGKFDSIKSLSKVYICIWYSNYTVVFGHFISKQFGTFF